MDISTEIGFGSYCFWNDKWNTKLSANALETGSTSTCNSIHVSQRSQVSKWVSYVYTSRTVLFLLNAVYFDILTREPIISCTNYNSYWFHFSVPCLMFGSPISTSNVATVLSSAVRYFLTDLEKPNLFSPQMK